MQRVLLDPGLEGRCLAWLRPVTGADEAVTDAVALLDRCLVAAGPGTVAPGMAAALPAADADRLLAAIHRDLFGDRIEADAPCRACGTAYSLSFSLGTLVDQRRPRRPAGVAGPDPRGAYRLGDVAFRLPSAADIAAAATADDRRGALLGACVVAGDAAGHADEIEAAMADLGPTLDLDLDATCPHCGAAQNPRFAIAGYLMAALAAERPFLLREVHRIARAYGWSYESIMGLPRGDRQELVRLIGSGPARTVPLDADRLAARAG